MKLQRKMIWLSGSISIVAFVTAYFLNQIGENFWCNIFIGLFSSGVLILVSSIAAYYYERNKEIFALYEGCYDFMGSLINLVRIDNRFGINELRDILAHSVDLYTRDVYYHVCELRRVNKYAKIRKLVDGIWENVRHVYLLLLDDKEKVDDFILENITKDEFQRYSWHIANEESQRYAKKLYEELGRLACHMDYYNKKHQKEAGEDNAQ